MGTGNDVLGLRKEYKMKKVVFLLGCLLIFCVNINARAADWAEADAKWQQFAREYNECLRKDEMSMRAKIPEYKSHAFLFEFDSPKFKEYFPDYKFFGDNLYSFALHREGDITVIKTIKSPGPCASASNLKEQTIEEFVIQAGIKIEIENKAQAEELVKLLCMIYSGNFRQVSKLKSVTFYVEKTADGWLVDIGSMYGIVIYSGSPREYALHLDESFRIKAVDVICSEDLWGGPGGF